MIRRALVGVVLASLAVTACGPTKTAAPTQQPTPETALDADTSAANIVTVDVGGGVDPSFGATPMALLPGLSTAFQWTETVSWAVRGGAAVTPNTQLEVVLPGGAACPATFAG